MSEIIRFAVGEATPTKSKLLAGQDMPGVEELPAAIVELVDAAVSLFSQLAEPRAVVAELTPEEFGTVYAGEGLNSRPGPLEMIYPQADGLALFAATVGEPVCAEIRRLFSNHDPALGYMLDTVASAATDMLSDLAGARYLRRMIEGGKAGGGAVVLPYSPGYCGWHISSQRSLFGTLHPASIGITLTDSCLMQPLKSVSGVLVAGLAEIHKFRPSYTFCEECRTRECSERMATVLRSRRG